MSLGQRKCTNHFCICRDRELGKGEQVELWGVGEALVHGLLRAA